VNTIDDDQHTGVGPSPQRRLPDRRLSGLSLLLFFILTWAVCWLVSVVCFRVRSGQLPQGNAEWWGYPIVTACVILPASFGGLVLDAVGWFAPRAPETIAIACMFMYWPAYITLAVLARRTGRVVYLVALVVLMLAASVYWHWVSIGAIGV
jgi:hypothetical protein